MQKEFAMMAQDKSRQDEARRAEARQENRRHRLRLSYLHPLLYWAIVSLVIWFAASAWTFFGAEGYMELSLAVVSGFLFMPIAILFAIWLVSRKYNQPDGARDESISFRDWASGEFETCQGPCKATDAAVEIVAPIAAVAFGLTAIGIVFHFTAVAL